MKKKTIWKYIFLLCFSGYLYVIIELLFRGKSDLSMLFTASICSIPMIFLNDIYSYELDFCLQVLICTLTTTGIEFIVGYYFVNQNHQIWDYSNQIFNIKGQVCLLFSFVWALISIFVIPLCDYIDYVVFDGMRPYYRIFGYTIWMKEKDVKTRKG